MVMTAQTSPRLSIRGVALAATLAAGGYLVTPIFACPPSPKEPAATSAARWAPKAPKAPRAPKAPKAPKARVIAVPGLPGDVTTFERFMQDRGGGESGTMSLEQRIEELQRQIDRLREQLQRLSQARLGLTFSPRVGPSGGVQISPSLTLAEAALIQAKHIEGLSLAYAAPVIQAKPVDALSLAYAAVAVGSGGGEGSLENCLQKAALSRGPVVARSYELDQGKLEALGELMVRNDVPIRVRVSGDSIEVHATEQQHCVFEAFVAMIDGKETVKAYRLPEGKLKALNQLMVRSDVPIFVQPGPEQIKVRGNPLEQAVFGAMVQMINPSSTPARTAVKNLLGTYERARQYEATAAEQVAGLRKLRASLRSLEGQVRLIQRQSDRTAERAVRLQDKGDQLQEQSEELREEAEDLDGRRRDARLKRAESLIVRAQECFQEAEALQIQADELQARSEDLEDAVEELQDRVEELEELEEEADEAYD